MFGTQAIFTMLATKYEQCNIPMAKIKLLETMCMVFWYNIALAASVIPTEKLTWALTQIIEARMLFNDMLGRKRLVLSLGCFLIRSGDLPAEAKAMLPQIFNAMVDTVKIVIEKIDAETDDDEFGTGEQGEMMDKWSSAYTHILARMQRGEAGPDEDEDSFYNECEDLYDSPIDDIDEVAYFKQIMQKLHTDDETTYQGLLGNMELDARTNYDFIWNTAR